MKFPHRKIRDRATAHGAPRFLVLLILGALLLYGCQGEPQSPSAKREQAKVHLILDFLPNPIHLGFYQSLADGACARAGLEVAIHAPASTADTLRLMAARRADFGLVSLLDFLNAYKLGEPIQIIMAVEQRPLAAVLTLEKSGITRPAELEGKLVGVTGVLSDELCWRSMVSHDGGNPDKIKTVTIGFNAVQNLAAGRVDAAIGFWSYEGVQLQVRQPARIFKLSDYGAPPYPEIVLFTRKETLATRPEMVRAFLAATVQGYEKALTDPETALENFARQVEGVTAGESRPFFEALQKVFIADAPSYGHINMQVLEEYLGWAEKTNLFSLEAAPEDFATNAFLPH